MVTQLELQNINELYYYHINLINSSEKLKNARDQADEKVEHLLTLYMKYIQYL